MTSRQLAGRQKKYAMKMPARKEPAFFADSLKFLKTTLSSFTSVQIFITCIADFEKCDDG